MVEDGAADSCQCFGCFLVRGMAFHRSNACGVLAYLDTEIMEPYVSGSRGRRRGGIMEGAKGLAFWGLMPLKSDFTSLADSRWK